MVKYSIMKELGISVVKRRISISLGSVNIVLVMKFNVVFI